MPKSLARPTSRPTSKLNAKPMPQPAWDDRAHVALSRLFNQEQRRMEREGLCEDIAGHELLTLEFIDTHRLQLAFTPRFLRSEERVSAGVFLHSLWQRARQKAASPPVGISRQLTDFATIYFPNFVPILRIEYLRMLRSASSADEIEHHGLTRLAAAYLNGAKDDAEREIRRLGGNMHCSIVDSGEARVEQIEALPHF